MEFPTSHLRQSLSVPDEDIPVRLMKEFSIELAVPLAHIYNKLLKRIQDSNYMEKGDNQPLTKEAYTGVTRRLAANKSDADFQQSPRTVCCTSHDS